MIAHFALCFSLFVYSNAFKCDQHDQTDCPGGSGCKLTIVETIPQNLTFDVGEPVHPTTFWSWKRLINRAEFSLKIASNYWTLRGSDVWSDPSDVQGEEIFSMLKEAGLKRQIRVEIAHTAGHNLDTELLQKLGAAHVRSLNFTKLVGAGILHTKLIIVDDQHFYVGSANTDWRSLTQVKELGIMVEDCRMLTKDMLKIFYVYWLMGKPDAAVPAVWPSDLATEYNNTNQLTININHALANVYLASSPPQFCPSGRTSDIDAILTTINQAEKFVYIAVMDYLPTTLYRKKNIFWPVIDDCLRRAAFERGVQVRILASWWCHSRSLMKTFLKSLAILDGQLDVQVKLFVVPSYTPAQAKIPFSRVNHNKYMVTEKSAYIGTSNWAGDYFISTGGVGLVVSQSSAQASLPEQLAAVFQRDWASKFASFV